MAKKIQDLKKLNEVYQEINLGEFFNKDYASYAVYRALQRIPNIRDGFAQTQRKVISTCLEKNITNKTKVSDLASVVSLHTHYHHGANSIESAITGLVPTFNNQLPLLREDGTYGSRSEREASASRYIESRLFKYAKLLFNEIDNKYFVEKQSTEGHEIEPVTMLPLLPLLLLNGQDQIGVGYACKILPRKTENIIKILEDILTGKRKSIPTDIPPMIPLFKGTIEANEKGGWKFLGKIEEINSKTYLISEVPPRFTRETYINVLEKLKDTGKIKDYSENIVGDDFEVEVKLSPGQKYTELQKRKMFGLEQNFTENITVVNSAGIIKKYDNIAEIFFEYIVGTLGTIKLRKEFLLIDLQRTVDMNTNKIRFIEMFNNDVLVLKNKQPEEIVEDLTLKDFQKFGTLIDGIETDDSFKYLTRMQMDSLTLEKIQNLKDEMILNTENLNQLKEKTAAILWLEDIKKIKEAIKKGD